MEIRVVESLYVWICIYFGEWAGLMGLGSRTVFLTVVVECFRAVDFV